MYDNSIAWHYLGLAQCDKKDYIEADRSLNNAIDFDENPLCFFDRARVNLLMFLESKKKIDGYTIVEVDGSEAGSVSLTGDKRLDEAIAAKLAEAKEVTQHNDDGHHQHHHLKGHENDDDLDKNKEGKDKKTDNDNNENKDEKKHSHDDTYVNNAIEDFTNAIILHQEHEVSLKASIKIALDNDDHQAASIMESEIVNISLELGEQIELNC